MLKAIEHSPDVINGSKLLRLRRIAIRRIVQIFQFDIRPGRQRPEPATGGLRFALGDPIATFDGVGIVVPQFGAGQAGADQFFVEHLAVDVNISQESAVAVKPLAVKAELHRAAAQERPREGGRLETPVIAFVLGVQKVLKVKKRLRREGAEVIVYKVGRTRIFFGQELQK